MELSAFETLLHQHLEWSDREGEDPAGKLYLKNEVLTNYKGEDIYLHDAAFENTTITASSFFDTNISYAYLYQCTFQQTTFREANFKKTEILESTFTDVTFEGCALPHLSLRDCKLRNVTFIDCDLSFAFFSKGEFEQITFRNCKLDGVAFSGQQLVNAVFADNHYLPEFPPVFVDVSARDALGTRAVASYQDI